MAGELGGSERSLGKELGQLPEGSVQDKRLKPHDQNHVLLARAGGAGNGRLLPGAWVGTSRTWASGETEQGYSPQGLLAVRVWVGITTRKRLFSFSLNFSRDGRVTAEKEFVSFSAGE